jgi:hypothetical protein
VAPDVRGSPDKPAAGGRAFGAAGNGSWRLGYLIRERRLSCASSAVLHSQCDGASDESGNRNFRMRIKEEMRCGR